MSAARRVLVCDDEPQILRALRVVLRDAGFEVVPAETAQEALDRAAVQPPDAAILDLVLPDGDGIEVCRALRAWSAMPIIVLSARSATRRRRSARSRRAPTTTSSSRSRRASSSPACRPSCGGPATAPASPRSRPAASSSTSPRAPSPAPASHVHLTPIEFSLLRTLARQRGRLMTHRALLVEVWGPSYADDTAVLRTHVANLRRKIEPPGEAPRHIRTDPGVGYRFTG